MDSNYSLADLKAAVGDDDKGMDSWFWIVVLFLFMFGGLGGNGWGANNAATQGALTRADLCSEFNFNNLNRSVLGIQNGLCDGFYAMNTGMLNGINGVQRDLTSGFNSVNSAIAQLGYQNQNCCCETNRNIDSLKAENYKNTCDIVNAVRTDGEATRALINSNTMQALRDQLCDVKNANAQYQQSQYILGSLGRYVTNPPCPSTACGTTFTGTTF